MELEDLIWLHDQGHTRRTRSDNIASLEAPKDQEEVRMVESYSQTHPIGSHFLSHFVD